MDWQDLRRRLYVAATEAEQRYTDAAPGERLADVTTQSAAWWRVERALRQAAAQIDLALQATPENYPTISDGCDRGALVGRLAERYRAKHATS